jgi:hypothetical protein
MSLILAFFFESLRDERKIAANMLIIICQSMFAPSITEKEKDPCFTESQTGLETEATSRAVDVAPRQAAFSGAILARNSRHLLANSSKSSGHNTSV